VTKPQNLLLRANRALADQSNEPAVLSVSDFVQPVAEVGRLDDDLFQLFTRDTMTGAVQYRLVHGPVPRGFEWIYEELNVVQEGGAVHDYLVTARWLDTSGADVHLNLAKATALMGVDDANMVRLGGDSILGPNTYSSVRPFRLYPGTFLNIESTTVMAIADIVRILISYRQRVSSQERFRQNDNAANLVITLA